MEEIGKDRIGWRRKDELGQGREEIIFSRILKEEQNFLGYKEGRRIVWIFEQYLEGFGGVKDLVS